MKCNPWRWLWGLIPILMLGWIAVLGERERVEADLSARTRALLDRAGHGWANITFEGRDAVLTGRALEEGEPAKALATTLDIMGVRVVDNRTSLIDRVERYEWSAIRRDNRIRVDGLVPSDKVRRDLIGIVKANFPTLDVDDRMKLARGAPPLDTWLGGVSFGLKQLALLREGRVDLEQTSLVVSGDALDTRSYRAIRSALQGQMPQGIRLKSEAVRPPLAQPYLWTARRQGRDLQLAGHVPSEAVEADLKRRAERAAAGGRVTSRLELASGAPDGFDAVAAALIDKLARLDDGSAQVRDRSATLSGTAESAAEAESVRAAMGQGVLASFRTSGDIRHREPQIKTVSPYETSAVLEPGFVVLAGYVPSEKAREALVTLARHRFPDRRVRDELQLGAGQPQGWEGCMEAGIDALRRLGNGRAAMTGRRLALIATADSDATMQSLPAEIRGRVGGTCDVDARLALDPAVLQAREDAERRRTEDDRRRAELTARERAEDDRRRADAAARDRAEQEARQRADEDRRRADAAARDRADQEARQRAEEERRRAEFERRRADELARLRAEEEARRRAEASERDARQQAEDERRRVAAAEQARTEATAAQRAAADRERQKEVDTCQEAMSKVAREGTINFSRASFDLDPASFPTLNKLAEAANRCPDLIVEIQGHTDSEGTPERNQRLSDRRASAVRDYLARAGVDPGRLNAIGYGQDRNIAPNDTAEGRARNRRIEFLVRTR